MIPGALRSSSEFDMSQMPNPHTAEQASRRLNIEDGHVVFDRNGLPRMAPCNHDHDHKNPHRQLKRDAEALMKTAVFLFERMVNFNS